MLPVPSIQANGGGLEGKNIMIDAVGKIRHSVLPLRHLGSLVEL